MAEWAHRFWIERELTWQQAVLERNTILATSEDIHLIRAAWFEAVKRFPDQKLMLIHHNRIMRRHPDDRAYPKGE